MRRVTLAALLCSTAALAQVNWPTRPDAGLVVNGPAQFVQDMAAASTPDGGVAVIWAQRDATPWSVRVQRVDALGNKAWGDAGVELDQVPGAAVGRMALLGDDVGGLWAAWAGTDQRRETNVQRVSPAGVPLWGDGGVTLEAPLNPTWWLRLNADPGRGAWLMFRSGNIGTDYKSAPLTDAPPTVWYSPGIGGDSQDRLQCAVFNDGRYLVAGGVLGYTQSKFQILSRSGGILVDGGVPLSPNRPRSFEVVKGDDDMPIIFWEEGTTQGLIHAQKVRPDGGMVWSQDGGLIVGWTGMDTSFSRQPSAVSDGDGGAVVVWQGHDGGYRAFAQHLGADGTLLWNSGQPVVVGDTHYGGWARVGRDQAGKYLVIWPRDQSFPNRQMAMRLDTDGTPLWGSTPTAGPGVLWAEFQIDQCNAGNCHDHVFMFPSGDGMVIAEVHAYEVMLHRIRPDGTLGGPLAVDAGTDAGTQDAGAGDAGAPDAGTADAGAPDAGTPDAGTPDAGIPDAGAPDAGQPAPDAGAPPQTDGGLSGTDGGTEPPTGTGCGCTTGAGAWPSLLLLAMTLRRRRPRA